MGPTGSGKTALAEGLASELNGALINADAFQAYRGFSIGTAKPEDPSRYALVDILSPEEPFGVGQFVPLAVQAISSAFDLGRAAIVVGGTGLYVRALFEGYATLSPQPTPELRAAIQHRFATEGLDALVADLIRRDQDLASRTDLKNPRRVTRALERLETGEDVIHFELPKCHKVKLGITWPTDQLDARTQLRLDQMFQNGWLEELRVLVQNGVKRSAPAMDAIGYRALYDVVAGNLTLEDARQSIATATRQFAKRQRTWLRSEPNLQVLEAQPVETLLERALSCIESCRD